MTPEEIEAIDDEICEIMIHHGPDRHVDGHDILTGYAVKLLSAERERCAVIAEDHECEECRDYTRGCSGEIAARIRRGE